jgi:hypothetical protein
MNYIKRIARQIRDSVPSVDLPDADTDALFAIYAVLALSLGPAVSPAAVHDAWSAWMSARDPDHPSIVPFEDLDTSTASDDDPYVAAIRRVADDLGIEPFSST